MPFFQYTNAFVHARVPTHRLQPRTLTFFWVENAGRRPTSSVVLHPTGLPRTSRRPPGHPHADDLRAIRMQTTLSKETPLSWKTVGAAVIVITGAPKANGKFWSPVLDNGSIKCVRNHGCGLHALHNGERVARIPQQL